MQIFIYLFLSVKIYPEGVASYCEQHEKAKENCAIFISLKQISLSWIPEQER